MPIRYRYFAIASIPLVLACSDAASTAPSGSRNPTGIQPTSPAPTVVSLAISPDSLLMPLGTAVSFSATKIMSDGSRVPAKALWESLSHQVLTMNHASGYAVAIGPGSVIVRAEADGLVAERTVVVPMPSGAVPSEVLTVQNFSMIEFRYEGTADQQWYYAPQLRLLAGQGKTVTVLRLTFSVPGLADPIPAWDCIARLASGVPRELNGEVYGDWALSVFGPGRRATGAEATATITYVDDAGMAGTMTVHGPIVHGSLPPSYGGDAGGCFHGYGSAG